MAKVLYEKDGRIGRITLNRPEVMNAIDDDLPRELAAAVAQADADWDVHVMVLSGAGKAFSAGYDLAHYAEGNGPNQVVQEMPWDPMQDFQFMWANTQAFMSLFLSFIPLFFPFLFFSFSFPSFFLPIFLLPSSFLISCLFLTPPFPYPHHL